MKYLVMRFPIFSILIIICLGLMSSCAGGKIIVPPSPYPISNDAFSVDTIAQGFKIPYGIAIVKETEYFITDRIGNLFHFKDGNLTEIKKMPHVLTFRDPGIPAILHGGLMDVSIHPNYSDNSWIYIAYLDGRGFAKVSRFKIQNHSAAHFETIFMTRNRNYYGNGMRIVWEDDTHFFLNVGGSTLTTNTNPILIAQDLNKDAGKVHRLMEDGKIPIDNPVFDGFTSPTTIWSYGHRDVQGLQFDKINNMLFGVEHGPKGGDEFNVIMKGGNYGWPIFTYGVNYDGRGVSTITKDSAAIFTNLPEHSWTVFSDDGGQAIAPACLLMVNASNISDWNNHFLLGSLAFGRLMKYNRDTHETLGLDIEGRVRTIKQLPSGDIIALIERSNTRQSNGMIVRISK